MIKEAYLSSGLGGMLESQSFENFSLEYYSDIKNDSGSSERDKIMRILEATKKYAKDFGDEKADECKNLIFFGGTGLGKTHLSSALAKTVIDRGYDVLYTSALNMISDFERAKFKGEGDTDRSFSAELLIIDDLGTEGVGAFTESFIYNVIDTRICKGMPTVVSTNLDARALSERYGERIFSRLLGVYKPLVFCGNDIRFEK